MENQLRLPTAPLEYDGQVVFTTKQLAELFGCTAANIRSALKSHKSVFEERKDYFLLARTDLRTFKEELAEKNIYSPTANNSYAPFSNLANSVRLWTESGALKLSKFIGTDGAKVIYSAFALGYKKVETPAIAPVSERQGEKNSLPPELDVLLKLIELTTDTNLRDELIRKAAALINS